MALPPLHFAFQSQDVYSSDRDVTPESFAEVLLRTGKLAEAKTEGQTPFPATEGKHCGTGPPKTDVGRGASTHALINKLRRRYQRESQNIRLRDGSRLTKINSTSHR